LKESILSVDSIITNNTIFINHISTDQYSITITKPSKDRMFYQIIPSNPIIDIILHTFLYKIDRIFSQVLIYIPICLLLFTNNILQPESTHYRISSMTHQIKNHSQRIDISSFIDLFIIIA